MPTVLEKMAPRRWTDLMMCKAHKAVVNGEATVSQASRLFKVPRTTLSDRVHGKIPLGVKAGRPPVLGEENEKALVRYITYMAEHRYPVTKKQVIGLAWAISLEKNKECFLKHGPTNKWWRCFRQRHKDLTMRKPENIDAGRFKNATPEVIDSYFALLKETMEKEGLIDKPGCVFNCDETAIRLEKSCEKVVVPVRTKHCHTINQGTSQHISVLCCISADGGRIPPLIIFSKGFPAGRSFHNEGPPNATYASTDSGFISQNLYVEWFEKNFLRFAPKERPLLLLQDGASAHMSPALIDMAIQNNVILLCFPPKLTHILQPCDVGVYRKLKTEVSKVVNQVKLFRGECWVSKRNFPAVFREVEEKTFTREIIKNAFRKCGIYPLDQKAISQELLNKTKNREDDKKP